METTYEIVFEAVLPVIAKIHVEAGNELEATALAERICESQKPGVKTAVFKLKSYPADFLMVQDIAEITPVEPGESGEKVWNREEIEHLLGEATA
jgi:hypothetical protein